MMNCDNEGKRQAAAGHSEAQAPCLQWGGFSSSIVREQEGWGPSAMSHSSY